MSATDPLREALHAVLRKHEAGPSGNPWTTLDAEARWCLNLLDDLETAALQALAAVPVEPNMTCQGDGKAKSSAEKLGAVPVEPEAWEWRAVLDRPCLDSPYHSVAQEEKSAREFAASLVHVDPAGMVWLERRRPGTAPGPWERVDPEPREDEADV